MHWCNVQCHIETSNGCKIAENLSTDLSEVVHIKNPISEGNQFLVRKAV